MQQAGSLLYRFRRLTMSTTSSLKQKPFINVTPLIDVLLVLLIIFMVVSPLKQARFTAKIPEQKPPDEQPIPPNPQTLVVTIAADHSLQLNGVSDLGTVEDTTKLSSKLTQVFADRLQNRAYSYEMIARTDLPDALRIQKTVF